MPSRSRSRSRSPSSFSSARLWGRFNLLRAASRRRSFDRVAERVQAVLVYAFGQKKFVRPEVGQAGRGAWRAGCTSSSSGASRSSGVQIITMFGRAYSDRLHAAVCSATGSSAGRTLLLRDLFEALVFVCVIVVHSSRWLDHAAAPPVRLRARRGAASASQLALGGVPHPGLHRHHHDRRPHLRRRAHRRASRRPARARGRGARGSRSRRWSAPLMVAIGRRRLRRGGRATSAWWMHNLAVLVMLNFLPLAKHFHVITSLPNVFFRKLEPIGAALEAGPRERDHVRHVAHRPVHLEAGAGHVQLHRVRPLLVALPGDGHRQAARAAPAAARPARLPLRAPGRGDREARAAPSRTATAPSRAEVGENVVGAGRSHDEVLWACNACRACEEACPVMIEYVDKIVDMRRHLVQEEARFPAELTRTFKGMETQSNPWGIGAEKRFDWAEGLDIPTHRRQARRRVPLLRRLRRRLRRPQQEDHAGLRARAQEGGRRLRRASRTRRLCNGETARRLGNEYLYQAMAQALRRAAERLQR